MQTAVMAGRRPALSPTAQVGCAPVTASGRQRTSEPTARGDVAWQAAACTHHDPSVFFPDAHGDAHAVTQIAKAICQRCVVRTSCLEHALAEGEVGGVWGGMTARERQAVVLARGCGR